MKFLITVLLSSFAINAPSFAAELPAQCFQVAVKAAESAYANPHMGCYGNAEVVLARMESQSSARLELTVSSFGPNQIDCTSQMFEVKVAMVNGVCKAVHTSFLGNINE